MLVSMLGISNYGSREIAKSINKVQLSKNFKSIYFLQLFLNVLCLFIYMLFLFFYNYEYKKILIIQGLFLISVAFDINWFFFGREKFKLTISRNLIIKILSLVCVFLFVKSSHDLWKYTLIMSGSTLISQIYLCFFIKTEINFNEKIKISDITKHIKPSLVLFIPVVSYSIYRVMDKTMIGAIAGTVDLGNYESAEKIINIPISFVTALGTVMMPHMSKKAQGEIKSSIIDTFRLTFFIVLPMSVGLCVVAHDFSTMFFGESFDKVGNILRFLVVSIVFSSIANVIRTNYLIPLKKDDIYVKSTVVGAIVNLVSNIIFIRLYGAYGACIGTVLAEFLVMFYQVVKTKKELDYSVYLKVFYQYLLKSLFMGVIVFITGFLIENILIKFIIQISLGAVIYALLNIKYIKDFFGIRKV